MGAPNHTGSVQDHMMTSRTGGTQGTNQGRIREMRIDTEATGSQNTTGWLTGDTRTSTEVLHRSSQDNIEDGLLDPEHANLRGKYGKLSLQIVNVCSLKKRLDTPEFRNALNSCDILLLCETRLDDADIEYVQEILDGLNLCAYFKNRRALTAYKSGGLCVVFDKRIKKYVQLINSNSKLVQWVRLDKTLLGMDKDLMLGNTYIPPENSRYYSLTPFQDL